MKYRVPAYQLRLVRDGSVNVADTGRLMDASKRAEQVARSVIGESPMEELLVMALDNRNRLIGVHTVARGGSHAVACHARDVFRFPMMVNGSAIILAHNHPGGDPTPSTDDLHFTQAVVAAGEILGICVVDHIIIGDPGQSVSMLDAGLLEAK